MKIILNLSHDSDNSHVVPGEVELVALPHSKVSIDLQDPYRSVIVDRAELIRALEALGE